MAGGARNIALLYRYCLLSLTNPAAADDATPQPGWRDSLLEIDPATNALVVALALDVSPDTVAADGPTLWVGAPAASALLAIRPN